MNAEQSPPMPAPDAETVSRAVLTAAINGADALMFATLKGSDSAEALAATLMSAARHETMPAATRKALDGCFATGLSRLGRKVQPEAMRAFHTALNGWIRRLRTLPGSSMDELAERMTDGGGMWIIAPHSPYWPHQLDDLVTRKDWAPPLCLWGLGDPESLVCCDSPLAIVGSRAADDYGCTVAQELAAQAAADGHLVVSGGAMGIDAAAHLGALAAVPPGSGATIPPGRTVAVFAGGLHHIGPQRNRRLFERMRRQGGALISELCPDVIPESHRFLLRNRLIAALASSVVVVQARPRSGALNTARWASDLNRQLYAVPGPITSPRNAGCNSLIHTGMAMIISSMRCIDEICHTAHPPIDRTADGIASQDAAPDGGTPSTQPILDAIAACRRRHSPATADIILAELQAAGMSPGVEQVLAELARLELEGVIVRERTGYAVADG